MHIELIEEIDWDETVVAVHPKSELKKRMFPHRASLIIPESDGKLLLCRRAKDKHPFPDTWCCAVGGKVAAGETYEQAANRELREELGTVFPLNYVTKFAYNQSDYKAMFAIYTSQIPRNALNFDVSEIQYLKEFSRNDLSDMVQKSPAEFAPTFLAALSAYLAAKPI